ncbi:uncharacterized protein [Arachis hypogaea]|uniref:uncharacterized protein isoform X1 n=1 Tax=Arachis hypogaea TaxID=3818 RepID=UPI000DED259B|nr:putative leucine-rich repeat-containing protein DDB_G0290503 isoform X2 [Arachis hypogaea]
MFRSARWWTDRNRVKALFKLHFHLTQVNECGVDALVLSIVPGDFGKPTTRLDQVTVRNGVCTWHNPVYETVKFIQDPKTGKFTDKLYQFLLSTGSSKGSPIGEASINIADYAEATKPSYLSLPIRVSHSDALLHVSIQRIQENSDQREEEECEDAKQKSHDWIISNHLSNADIDESTRSNSSEEVTAKAMNNTEELSVNCSTSSESDTTLSSSDDSSGLDSPRKLGLKRKKNIHSSKNVFLSGMSHNSKSQKLVISDSTTQMHDDMHQRIHFDWPPGDSTNGSNHDIPKEDSEESHPTETEKLKAELAALARHVDVSDMELQTLRKQIVKETKRGQDLSKEILILKEERDAFKLECENLKSFHKRMDEARLRSRSQLETRDLGAFVEEIRQELSYEKDMNANLRLQLKKMQESNAELVLAVQDLEEMLEQSQCNNKDSKELVETEMEKLVQRQSNGNNDTEALEKKIIDLYGEIEMYRRDKDDLEVQLEQLALDYEILKQENHSIVYKLEQSQVQEQLKMHYECSSPPPPPNNNDPDLEMHIENLEKQLKEQSEDFSNSLATIKELETHIRRLEEEFDKKKHGFEADLEAVTRDKVEHEQRAIKAEEALRKTRMANAKTAERLQEEFRRLSSQMTSTFDANEKAAMKALKEASQLRSQKSLLEEMLRKAKQEIQLLQSDYDLKLDDLSNQMNTMTVQIQQMKLEIEDKTKQLEDQKKNGEQAGSDFSEKIRVLKAENEDLNGEIWRLREQVEGNESRRDELELMKKSMEESEEMLQRGSAERNELVSTIALLKKEAEQSVNEARRLEKEVEAVRAQYSELKGSVSEEAAEKEKLRKQVLQMKSEIKKKEDALSSMERRLKDSLKNKKTASAPQNSKDMASLREKIKMLEQGLVKSKEKALESSSSSFLNKEKELQTKIDELENKVEEFNQIIALQQVSQDLSIISSKDVCDEKEMVSELTERNKSMESELKEMQERYLEMSLKFAEVEGERQQLVMTLRNLNLNLKTINKP